MQHALELSEKILSIKQGREIDGENDKQGKASAVKKSLEMLGRIEEELPPGKLREKLVPKDVSVKLENISKHEEEFAGVKSEIAGLKDEKNVVLGPKEKEVERIDEEVSLDRSVTLLPPPCPNHQLTFRLSSSAARRNREGGGGALEED